MASLGTSSGEYGALVGTKKHKSGENYSILLVCTANQCRSPMAEVLFKEFLKLQDQSAANWRVESAGVNAAQNSSASPHTQEVVAELGLDLSQHQSKVVTKDLLKSFQLILTMEKWQRQFILQLCPEISNRVLMLSQVIGIEKDIIDPIGMSNNNYRDILKEIQSYFEKGWKNILHLAKK